MHTPGPWRSMRVETGEYYTRHIEITGGHIASLVGWTTFGTVCPTTEANARLIERAPEMAAALQALLAWEETMGGGQQGSIGIADRKLTGEGWNAPCWQAAHNVRAQRPRTRPDARSRQQRAIRPQRRPGLTEIAVGPRAPRTPAAAGPDPRTWTPATRRHSNTIRN